MLFVTDIDSLYQYVIKSGRFVESVAKVDVALWENILVHLFMMHKY